MTTTKLHTIIKTGYTTGAYGCSGEYFTLILIHGNKTAYRLFEGMYGAEDRIMRTLADMGYPQFYTSANWGKCIRKDIHKGATLTEHALLEELPTIIAALEKAHNTEIGAKYAKNGGLV